MCGHVVGIRSIGYCGKIACVAICIQRCSESCMVARTRGEFY